MSLWFGSALNGGVCCDLYFFRAANANYVLQAAGVSPHPAGTSATSPAELWRAALHRCEAGRDVDSEWSYRLLVGAFEPSLQAHLQRTWAGMMALPGPKGCNGQRNDIQNSRQASLAPPRVTHSLADMRDTTDAEAANAAKAHEAAAPRRLTIGFYGDKFVGHPTAVMISGLIAVLNRQVVRTMSLHQNPDEVCLDDPFGQGSSVVISKPVSGVQGSPRCGCGVLTLTPEWARELQEQGQGGKPASKEELSLLRQVLATDMFLQAHQCTSAETADAVVAAEVDILVDLKVHAGFFSRMMAAKPAPIVANYLGHPGTAGGSSTDYIIVDAISSPVEGWQAAGRGNQEQRDCRAGGARGVTACSGYSEGRVYMPGTYQANNYMDLVAGDLPITVPAVADWPDDVWEMAAIACARNVSKPLPLRFHICQQYFEAAREADNRWGATGHGRQPIILGSFNTHRKLSPEILTIWAQILTRHRHVLLWIMGVRETAVDESALVMAGDQY